jgi:hypothetical protein
MVSCLEQLAGVHAADYSGAENQDPHGLARPRLAHAHPLAIALAAATLA